MGSVPYEGSFPSPGAQGDMGTPFHSRSRGETPGDPQEIPGYPPSKPPWAITLGDPPRGYPCFFPLGVLPGGIPWGASRNIPQRDPPGGSPWGIPLGVFPGGSLWGFPGGYPRGNP